MPGALNGSHDVPMLPGGVFPAGVDMGSALVLPPGAQVFYVRGNGAATTGYSYDPPGLPERLIASVSKAASYAVAARGDVIVCLPGHTETIATADAWSSAVAGLRIYGVGSGNSRPTFTWTTATSTILMDVANMSIENCILNMDPGAGTVNVAAPITISAAGCRLIGNKIRMGTDANAKVTIGITTTAAGDDLEIVGNEIFGATAAECTTMIQFVGADRLKFHGNSVVGATSAVGVGVIRFLTTASTDIKMVRNIVRNNKAASVNAITGMAGVSGEVDELLMVTLNDTGVGATSTAWATVASLVFGGNVFAANTIGERAVAFGTASA